MIFFNELKKYKETVKAGMGGFEKIISASPPDDFIEVFGFVDDEQLVFDWTLHKAARIVYSIPLVILICVFTYPWIKYPPANFLDILLFLFVYAITVGPCLVGLAFIIINPSRKITFNRLDSTVTLPAYKRKWLSKETVTQPFDKTGFYIMGGTRSAIPKFCVCILGTLHNFFVLHSRPMKQYNDFSALVWYMDKNRPLPPGKVLDSFREKDYKRRKAEGFPKPLYFSRIKISEWEGATKVKKQYK
jgi:hypothetical protein